MFDYGARFYDPVIGRWNVPDMLAELAPSLTPFRYCFNNPVNYTDPFGLWERTANGYTTDKNEDIKRFFDMIQIENHSLKNKTSMSQMSSFIEGEMKTGGLGTLSDGSKLAKGFTINQQRDFYGGKHWVTDQKSYNNFWHSVQGDLTPDALDARTIGNNLAGLTYTGSDNPKKFNGDDDYSYRSSIYDKPGYIHDLAYRDLGVSGLNGLFNEKRAIKADYTFVAQNLAIAYNPKINPILRARAYLLGVGLGLIALPKTIENYMPTMVNPPSR